VSPQRDCSDGMSRYHIDDDTADRLLSGRLAPEDAPSGYAGLAALACTATGPATPAELAREPADVAAGVAAVVSGPVPLSTLSRRRSMIGKLLTAKAAAGAAVLALGAGTAAAAISGALPIQATSHANTHAKAGLATAASHVGTGGDTSSGHARSSGHPASPGTSTTPGSVPTTGTANSHAMFGLCAAFLAGGSSSTSGKDASAAFKVLIAETGGSASATTAFCKSFVTTDHPGGKPSRSVEPSMAGKPSRAGKSSSHAPVTTPNAGATSTANQASGGASSSGTSTADQASGGASSAGSANSGSHAGAR
jgi:hypothetical protein